MQEPRLCGWLSKAVDPAVPLLWLDTSTLPAAGDSRDHGSFHNACEACICAHVAAALVARGVAAELVGITSPYSRQIARLSHEMAAFPELAGASVMTIDKFQGQERAAMIISLVRSNASGLTGALLADFRRVNVALTRARTKLIVVGNAATVAAVPTMAAARDGVDALGVRIDLAAPEG